MDKGTQRWVVTIKRVNTSKLILVFLCFCVVNVIIGYSIYIYIPIDNLSAITTVEMLLGMYAVMLHVLTSYNMIKYTIRWYKTRKKKSKRYKER